LASPSCPRKGAKTRRKADGLTGEVYVSSPKTDLVAVRWFTDDDTGTFLFNLEQFANEWELTNASHPRGRWRVEAATFLLILGTCLYFGIRTLKSGHFHSPAPTSPRLGSSAESDDPQAVQKQYGAVAASACSMGADDFVNSVSRYGFKWEDIATPGEKFDENLTFYTAPGITTSISDKLYIQDSSGSFKRVQLSCSYDTRNNKVLRYAMTDSAE